MSTPIDPAQVLRDAASSADGAVLLFMGVVRAENDGREVVGLEYEAFAEMAVRQMSEIAAAARARFRTGEIRITHREGLLQIGEASIAVVVAAPHRGEAYAASRFVIDEVKRRVPIWKREAYRDGDVAWVPGTTPSQSPLAPAE